MTSTTVGVSANGSQDRSVRHGTEAARHTAWASTGAATTIRAGGWTEHDLAQGRVVIAADAGSEVELEAIAIGPNDVELARSGVDLVTIPRPVEVWEEPWFWGVLGGVAVALGVVGGSLGWALTQPRPLTLSTTWTLGM